MTSMAQHLYENRNLLLLRPGQRLARSDQSSGMSLVTCQYLLLIASILLTALTITIIRK